MKPLLILLSFSFSLLSAFGQPSDSVAEPTQPPVSSEHNLNSLLGKWYFSGDINKVCYIANAKGTFFAINENNTPFILNMTSDKTLIFGTSGSSFTVKVLPEYILGYGWWWSRNPTNLKN